MRQNFPVYQLFWNLNILFNEINSLQYKNLKESDRHNFPSHRFKPTIWDQCRTSVNWMSHYQILHKKNVSFGVITHFLLLFIKRHISYIKALENVLKSEVQIIVTILCEHSTKWLPVCLYLNNASYVEKLIRSP